MYSHGQLCKHIFTHVNILIYLHIHTYKYEYIIAYAYMYIIIEKKPLDILTDTH